MVKEKSQKGGLKVGKEEPKAKRKAPENPRKNQLESAAT